MTLLSRMGPHLSSELARALLRCHTHGPTPWVPTCQCVLEGATPEEASTASVLCAEHVRLAEDGDPASDDNVTQACLQCLTDRGIL